MGQLCHNCRTGAVNTCGNCKNGGPPPGCSCTPAPCTCPPPGGVT
jgi:hypothetical protein